MPRLLAAILLVASIDLARLPGQAPDARDRLTVGIQPDGRIVVATNQILEPAGRQVTFPGRPVALVAIDGGKTLIAKNMHDLTFIDVDTALVKETLATPSAGGTRPGLSVVGLVERDGEIYASGADGYVRAARRGTDGRYGWAEPFKLPKTPPDPNRRKTDAHPAGMAIVGGKLLVAATRTNAVHVFDVVTRAAQGSIAVGVAPYAVLPIGADKAYVSNWGGDPPAAGEPQRLTSGTPVHVDRRTDVADRGSVSVLERSGDDWRLARSIAVGLHPSGLTASRGGRFVYVANAASDTVSVIDTASDNVVETIDCRPEARLPFGSGSNALALSPDGRILYVANGTNNCVAAVRLGRLANDGGSGPDRSAVTGLIPTGWYPGAVLVSDDGKRLFVANVKGHGALSQPRPKEKGHNSHDHLGTVSIIDLPDAAGLARMTERVNANNRLAYSIAGLGEPRPAIKPTILPERHGEPSVIRHVVFVIKENRTYDQVFGDMTEGNGDPRLCIFGEKVTPNHHKLAREFVLLDNFYCSGVNSADGHSWTDAAYVTDYLEKSFGGFTRSYPYEGDDPLAFPPTGFLWDNALSRKKSFRNYGEFTKTTYAPKRPTWAEMYADFKGRGGKFTPTATTQVDTLRAYTHFRYPGFQLNVPDVYRAGLFLEELAKFEQRGSFPDFVYLYLPCDHTSGTRPGSPTPRAMVADNDLALGRCVEALSRSKFWANMCVFVTEDDPQNGFDHVDGHRTVGQVISPYTRRRGVDSTCYNQTGMVKTIELMLGLPPMNQMDLSATPMRGCFRSEPELTPYSHVPNRIELDEMNRPMAALRGRALDAARASLALNLDDCDAADEDVFNRILWFSVRGEEPYPGDRK
jgi:YVTN family beta-propeller protein